MSVVASRPEFPAKLRQQRVNRLPLRCVPTEPGPESHRPQTYTQIDAARCQQTQAFEVVPKTSGGVGAEESDAGSQVHGRQGRDEAQSHRCCRWMKGWRGARVVLPYPDGLVILLLRQCEEFPQRPETVSGRAPGRSEIDGQAQFQSKPTSRRGCPIAAGSERRPAVRPGS
jgi:hypothetical protein